MSRLSAELEAAQEQARELQAELAPETRADGFTLAVEGWSDEPGYQLALQSLDTRGARLLSVLPATDHSAERAIVWLPYGAVGRFFRRIEEYAADQTSTGKPRNQPLVANISELRLAILHDLWQEPDPFPDSDEPRWWEVWLARLKGELDPSTVLRAVAAQRQWSVVDETLTFPDNVVVLVHTSASELATLLSTSAIPSELHKARVTSEILDLDHFTQREFVTDLQTRMGAALLG